MEIGNLLFGHSRGIFEVNRVLEKSPAWRKLLEMSLSDCYGVTDDMAHRNFRGGYENDVFCIRPYYWGDDEEQVALPNFIFKATGFEIRWYKYPFRGSYMNMNLNINEINNIFSRCIESIKLERGEID